MEGGIRWGPVLLVAASAIHAALAVAAADHRGALVAVSIVLAVALVLLLSGPIAGLRARRVAAATTPRELPEPPSDLPPALVALLQNLRGGASEEQGRTLEGPPIWKPDMWRRPRLGTFERDVLQVAANRSLLTPTASAAGLFVLPMALAACLLGADSGFAAVVMAWGFGPGAFVGLFAALLMGHRRTVAGELEAARWLAHARSLRATTTNGHDGRRRTQVRALIATACVDPRNPGMSARTRDERTHLPGDRGPSAVRGRGRDRRRTRRPACRTADTELTNAPGTVT